MVLLLCCIAFCVGWEIIKPRLEYKVSDNTRSQLTVVEGDLVRQYQLLELSKPKPDQRQPKPRRRSNSVGSVSIEPVITEPPVDPLAEAYQLGHVQSRKTLKRTPVKLTSHLIRDPVTKTVSIIATENELEDTIQKSSEPNQNAKMHRTPSTQQNQSSGAADSRPVDDGLQAGYSGGQYPGQSADTRPPVLVTTNVTLEPTLVRQEGYVAPPTGRPQSPHDRSSEHSVHNSEGHHSENDSDVHAPPIDQQVVKLNLDDLLKMFRTKQEPTLQSIVQPIVQVQSSLAKPINPRDIPSFSGQSHEDVDDWIQLYSRAGEYYGWTDADFSRHLLLALSKSALEWHAELTRNGALPWPIVKLKMLEHYAKTRIDLDIMGDNERLSFNKDPNVYIDHTLRILRRRNLNASEESKVDALFSGLSDTMKPFFVRDYPKTVETFTNRLKDAIRELAYYRKGLGLPTSMPVTVLPAMVPAVTRGFDPFASASIENQYLLTNPRNQTALVSAYATMSSEKEATQASKSVEKLQVEVANLREQFEQQAKVMVRANEPKPQEVQPFGRTETGEPICYGCGRTGHIKRYCRSSNNQNRGFGGRGRGGRGGQRGGNWNNRNNNRGGYGGSNSSNCQDPDGGGFNAFRAFNINRGGYPNYNQPSPNFQQPNRLVVTQSLPVMPSQLALTGAVNKTQAPQAQTRAPMYFSAPVQEEPQDPRVVTWSESNHEFAEATNHLN